jgi:hypothetical protein
MKRFQLVLASVVLAVLSLVPAAASFDSEPPKDAEYTHARIRYHMSPDAMFRQRELPWHHDYPYSDEAFPTFLKEATRVYTASNAYQIIDIDDPELFKYPFAYLCEPGFLELNSKDTANLRQFFERGGFLFVDDFRGARDLNNLAYQMKKVFPNRNLIPLNLSHPIFNTFYQIESLDMRPPYGFEPVQFMGMEDDHGQLIMVVNYNNDLGEIWQWLDEGTASLQDAAMSLKLGTNYLLYAMTR